MNTYTVKGDEYLVHYFPFSARQIDCIIVFFQIDTRLKTVTQRSKNVRQLSLTCKTLLQAIIEQGGLTPGGLNFDCKIRRESTDLEDMFIAHIGKSVMYKNF